MRKLISMLSLFAALFTSSPALAGTEYSDLASWQTAMGAGASASDWTSLTEGGSADGAVFGGGYQLSLVAGTSLTYEASNGLIMSADSVSNTTIGITLTTESLGVALEATSVFEDLTAEGYYLGTLVDSVTLTNPGSEAITQFSGVVFTGLVDEIRIVSSSTGDGVIFPAMWFDFDDDADGQTESGGDCDDADSTTFTGGTEVCDGADNDCNGSVDDGAIGTTWCEDADLDGHCSTTSTVTQCDDPGDTWSDGNPTDDCDDADSTAYPGATDIPYDGIDNDCVGDGDEEDVDNDGYTSNDVGGSDCDDSNEDVNPGTAETCNDIDDDCSGSIDDSALDATTWCEDADLDGHCSTTSTVTQCDDPGDTWSDGNPQDDCDDADSTAYPGNTEVCDGIDNDCSGSADEGPPADASTWCNDNDGDGYSDPSACVTQCSSPGDTYSNTSPVTDCDDAEEDVNPGESEVPYNGTDDDCNPTTADDDLDGDGWESAYDCDDDNADINPDATEVADGVDNDCDGTSDEGTSVYDDDGDLQTEEDGDCNDSDPTVYLGAPEECNTVDNDCDGLSDADDGFDTNVNGLADCLEEDLDGDGYIVDDCAPFDDTTYPGADEDCDGIDNDCDSVADEETECYDDDGDSLTELAGDCDDSDPLVNPNQTEVWYDGIDSDCSGGSDYDQDADGDDLQGFGGEDCNDSDPTINSQAEEILEDGIDNDCDESTPDVEDTGDDDSGDDDSADTGDDDTGPIILEDPKGTFIGGGGCACDSGGRLGKLGWQLLIGCVLAFLWSARKRD